MRFLEGGPFNTFVQSLKDYKQCKLWIGVYIYIPQGQLQNAIKTSQTKLAQGPGPRLRMQTFYCVVAVQPPKASFEFIVTYNKLNFNIKELSKVFYFVIGGI